MQCKENWRAEFSCSTNKPGYAQINNGMELPAIRVPAG